MAAPVVEGITYPAHVHAEYPKVVYEGGDLKAASRTVANEAEELEALDEGFAAYVAPEAEYVPGSDSVAAGAGDDTITGSTTDALEAAGDDTLAGGQAADALAEPTPEPEPPVVDANGDGHDDATGKFVDPNPGRRGAKRS